MLLLGLHDQIGRHGSISDRRISDWDSIDVSSTRIPGRWPQPRRDVVPGRRDSKGRSILLAVDHASEDAMEIRLALPVYYRSTQMSSDGLKTATGVEEPWEKASLINRTTIEVRYSPSPDPQETSLPSPRASEKGFPKMPSLAQLPLQRRRGKTQMQATPP